MADKSQILDRDVARELGDDDQNLIKQARKRFTETLANWSDIRKEAVKDQKYFKGLQNESDATRASRSRGNNPQVQVNMLPNFVQQVENSIRQQNIGLNVHPTDSDGTEETAKVLQGIIRHIEHNSQAKTAYLWAAGSHGALVPGFGFMKLECNYLESRNGIPTFDQEIFIRGVKDPMTVLPDFFAQLPDFSDADFWFEFEEMDKAVYKERYSKSKLSGAYAKDWGSLSTTVGASWITANGCKVVKYWYKTPTVRHWALFEDGTQGFLDEFGADINDEGEMEIVDKSLADAKFPKMELDEMDKDAIARAVDSKTDPGAPTDAYPNTDSQVPLDRLADVIRVREVTEYSVSWILTNGFEILDRGEWNDSEFPFVGVVGQDHVVDGKRDMHGIIRYSKDPQKMVNFFTSQVVRRVDAANKSAWIAAAESIPEPQRKRWDNSNHENPATLYYQAYDDQGRQLPAPTRGDAIEPAVQQLMAGSMMFAQNIKATIGIYEAGLGQAMGDRQSGSAIETLAERGENANFHFSDNFVLSMKRLGTLILRLIPKIYDTARTVRIVGLDDDAELVKINQLFTQDGQQKQHDIKNAGCYDVIVDTGPTYASKKSEMVDQMLKFVALNPQMAPFFMDLVAKNLDWDTTGAVADRIQLVQSQQFPWLHPANGQQKIPPQAMATIAQLQKQVQGLMAASQHVQQLYAVEKYKNDTGAIAHQSKVTQIQLKGFYDLQTQKLHLLGQMQKERNQTALAKAKAELDHVNTRIDHHLKTMGIVLDAIPDQPGLPALPSPSMPDGSSGTPDNGTTGP